jgi:hypothetical protein
MSVGELGQTLERVRPEAPTDASVTGIALIQPEPFHSKTVFW